MNINTNNKMIKPKLGLLQLAEKLQNVSEACRRDTAGTVIIE